MKIYVARKKMKINILLFWGAIINPNIKIKKADIMFDPLIPPLKTQIIETIIIANMITGVKKGLIIPFDLT